MSRLFHFDTFSSARLITTTPGNNSIAWIDDLKEFEGVTKRNLILLREHEAQSLTDVQRLIFLWVTICIAIIAVSGNLLVIYVNISR